MKPKNFITFVVGPTASGKSKWALDEAKRNNGIILNADSVQVYKYLDIGAAKPSKSDREFVRHELYDLVTPDEEFTAGDYRRSALQTIEKEIEKHNLYIVGGSGFYIQALEKGMFEVEAVRAEVKAEVDLLEKKPAQLWARLQEIDPQSAAKLNVNDLYRVRRALEISLSEGRPWSQISEEFRASPSQLALKYNIRKVGLNIERSILRERIVKRTQQMLEMGFLEEAKRLLEMGFGSSRVMSSVGYRECGEVLAGRSDAATLEDAIITSTMQLAKKQMTWFKRDNEIEWFSS